MDRSSRYRPPYRYPLVPRRQALIDARERAGLSQKELAEKLGVRRDSLLMIEIGKRHPSFALMARWTRELGAGFEIWDVDEDGQQPEGDICNVA